MWHSHLEDLKIHETKRFIPKRLFRQSEHKLDLTFSFRREFAPCIAKYLKRPHWRGTTVSSETSPLNENRLNRVWRFNTNGSFTFLLHLTVLSMCSICLEAPFISRNELGYNYLLQLIQNLEIGWPVISISLLKWHHKLLSQDRLGLHWDPKLSSSLVIRFAHERITVSWNNNSTPAHL